MITSNLIKDSLNIDTRDRLASFIWTYPRFIHSEIMTHRLFSRNAASSRAIPIHKQIKQVEDGARWVLSQDDLAELDYVTCPLAIPVVWGANNSGMQSKSLLSDDQRRHAVERWARAALNAAYEARKLNNIGAHKQIVNRVMEPYVHMTVLVTSSDWGNYTALRAHEDAQPEFQVLAYNVLDDLNQSAPDRLEPGDWHLPFEDKATDGMALDDIIKICVARAARTSYTTFDKDFEPEKDFGLHDGLLKAGHMSPFEHPAIALSKEENYLAGMENRGNFQGFQQYRKMLPNECRTDDRLIDKFAVVD